MGLYRRSLQQDGRFIAQLARTRKRIESAFDFSTAGLQHVWLRFRRQYPWVLTLAGFLILLYVAFQYFSMWSEQRAFAREWSVRSPTTSGAPVVVDGNVGLARLVIPKIGLQAFVLEGTSYKTLKLGPGHVLNTALPGEPGNAVLAAHRDTFFRKLNDLAPGDPILVERQGHTYEFIITGRKIVNPGDLSVLDSTADATLTLITCYPPHYIGPAPKRLIVSGRLVPGSPSTPLLTSHSGTP